MGEKIELGKAIGTGVGMVSSPQTLNERILNLEKRIADLTAVFNEINNVRLKSKRQEEEYNDIYNSIPKGTRLLGKLVDGVTYFMITDTNGYFVGTQKYDSLSLAASEINKKPINGDTFWTLTDGRTVKEAYGKKK